LTVDVTDPAVRHEARIPTRVLVVLGAATALGTFSMSVTIPSLPKMAHDLEVGESSVQLTLTLCVLGIAAGQLFAGPLSDRRGRRGPFVFGVAIWTLLSLACSLSPSVTALSGLRFAQGFFAAFGLTIARAIVRDVAEGPALYKNFARLAMITGVAPIISPTFGGLLLLVTQWRGIFVVLGVAGVVLTIGAFSLIKETHPPQERTAPGIGTILSGYRTVLSARAFVQPALVAGLGYGALFSYVSTASFLFQNKYGMSGTEFGLFFGMNGLGFALAAQVSARQTAHHREVSILRTAICGALTGCCGFVAFSYVDAGGPWFMIASLCVILISLGGTLPLASSMAMKSQQKHAGSASGMLGVIQFALGAAIGPVAGLLGASGLALGATMATCLLGALVVLLLKIKSVADVAVLISADSAQLSSRT
jgi:DHA1 family bicyclomycin/chloramphenicol resistance-like MFS transporter